MHLIIHSVAGNTCLVDFDREGYGPAHPDPEGFTQLLELQAALDLRRDLNVLKYGKLIDFAGPYMDLSYGALD